MKMMIGNYTLSGGMRGRLFCCLYRRGVSPVRALNQEMFFYPEVLWRFVL